MSIFELGPYRVEIIDEYESEEKSSGCIEVKRRDDSDLSVYVFLGVMPEKIETSHDLNKSDDIWQTLRRSWFPPLELDKEYSVGLRGVNPNSKYGYRFGWYDIIAGNDDIDTRRIIYRLEEDDALNFACKADKGHSVDEMHKFLEDLVDTTKVEPKEPTSE